MFQNTFNSVINTYQYLNMMGLTKIALENINFKEGFQENLQFSLISSDNDHIKFRDNIRQKVFEMKKEEPYSCGKFYYTIKENVEL